MIAKSWTQFTKLWQINLKLFTFREFGANAEQVMSEIDFSMFVYPGPDTHTIIPEMIMNRTARITLKVHTGITILPHHCYGIYYTQHATRVPCHRMKTVIFLIHSTNWHLDLSLVPNMCASMFRVPGYYVDAYRSKPAALAGHMHISEHTRFGMRLLWFQPNTIHNLPTGYECTERHIHGRIIFTMTHFRHNFF